MNRRRFVQGLAGLMVPAALDLVPEEEALRRFWALGGIPRPTPAIAFNGYVGTVYDEHLRPTVYRGVGVPGREVYAVGETGAHWVTPWHDAGQSSLAKGFEAIVVDPRVPPGIMYGPQPDGTYLMGDRTAKMLRELLAMD